MQADLLWIPPPLDRRVSLMDLRLTVKVCPGWTVPDAPSTCIITGLLGSTEPLHSKSVWNLPFEFGTLLIVLDAH